MIDIKLLRLELTNFAGIKALVVEPGQETQIYGDNATGKTTVFNAWLWLLFGKNSENKTDFQIKTLEKSGEAKHKINHSVEATIAIDDNGKLTDVSLKKVYKEKWVKKRGQATSEFSGHETDHFVDDVPTSKSEYEWKISEIIGSQSKEAEKIFRLITDVNHFNVNLPWQDKRKQLIEVAGNVDIEEIYTKCPQLEQLRDGIGNNTVEDYRKVAKAKLTTLNKELKDIPPRIDELTKLLPVLESDDSVPAMMGRVEAEKKNIEDLQAKRQRIESGGEIGEVKLEIANLKSKMVRDSAEGDKEKATRKAELLDKQAMLTRQVDTLNFDKEKKTESIKGLTALVKELRNQWDDRQATVFDLDVDSVCSMCGQDMPEDKIDEIIKTAEADFNVQKAKALEGINKEGKASKGVIAKVEIEYVKLTEQIEALLDKRFKIEQQIESLGSDEAAVDPALAKELEGLEATADKIFDGLEPVADKIFEEIQEHQKLLDEFETVLRDIKAAETNRARISELGKKERMIAAEYERWEEQVHLTELFIKTHVEMLDSRINSKFELARFKLFNTQINEGIEETCETVYNGVPYGDLNHGMRVNVGLDIIKTLSAHFGLSAPVFVDNAESITKLTKMQCQVIQLVVSKKDKTLRVAA